MSVVADFSTITEMFEALTAKFAGDQRPLLRYKRDGVYEGLTYDRVRADVEHFALGLLTLGVQRGDRVALISENRPEWVITDMATLSLGAVDVPMYTTLTPKQIEFILNDSGATMVIVSTQLQYGKIVKIASGVPALKNIIVMNKLADTAESPFLQFSEILQRGKQSTGADRQLYRERKAQVKPEDLLTLIYTSGTTGNPKGVVLTHHNMVSNIHNSVPCVPITTEDTMLSYLPLSHSFERMAGYYTGMSCGATIAYAESVDTLGENLLEVKPTIITSVPRFFEKVYNRLMKQINNAPPLKQKIFYWAVDTGKKHAQAKKTGSIPPFLALQYRLADSLVLQKIRQATGGRIRYMISGGAALAKELGEFFEALGLLIIEGYGLSECSPVISVNRPDNYKFGSVGKPIHNIEVKIADDGEILMRGENVMKGYWNNKEETDQTIDSDHWLHTGDIGMFDEDGFLHITDRKKHLFVSSGGKNIAPQPIENAFLQSPYIDQCVLIGEKRMFCTALIVPDFDAVKDYAKREDMKVSGMEELLSQPKIKQLFDREIATHQKDFAQYERVRKYTLLLQPLTIENGEMTPSMKIRRSTVNERYKSIIDKMYEGIA